MEYFSSKKFISDFKVHPKMINTYPDVGSFIHYAKKGLYSYDMHNGCEILVAEPTTPFLFNDLPVELQNLLTEF
jgi:hypothetical protein